MWILCMLSTYSYRRQRYVVFHSCPVYIIYKFLDLRVLKLILVLLRKLLFRITKH